MAKKQITKAKYMQLCGLLSLSRINNEKQRDILKAVMEITGEKDEVGHSNDAVWGDYSAVELLETLNIKVRYEKHLRLRLRQQTNSTA